MIHKRGSDVTQFPDEQTCIKTYIDVADDTWYYDTGISTFTAKR